MGEQLIPLTEELPVRQQPARVPAQRGAVPLAALVSYPKLLLDTGAHHSDLLATSKPGKALLPRSEASHEAVYAASGKVTPRTVHDAHLHIGALDVSNLMGIPAQYGHPRMRAACAARRSRSCSWRPNSNADDAP